MNPEKKLIFRYDNVPHHPEIDSFPNHKHYSNKVGSSVQVDLRQIIEEIIDGLIDE